MNTHDLEDKILTETMQSIKASIGTDGLLSLSSLYNGSKVYIPFNILTTHKIYQALGADKAQSLQKDFGGQYLYIPRVLNLRLIFRNSQIIECRKRRLSVSSIAKLFNLSERYIWKICSEYRGGGHA